MEDILAVIAHTFAIATAILAGMVVPYSVIAILFRYHDPRLVVARSEPFHALHALNRGVRRHMVIAVVILTNYLVRVYARLEPLSPPQPAWGFAMSMVTAFAVLALLFGPSVELMHIKFQMTRDGEEKGEE